MFRNNVGSVGSLPWGLNSLRTVVMSRANLSSESWGFRSRFREVDDAVDVCGVSSTDGCTPSGCLLLNFICFWAFSTSSKAGFDLLFFTLGFTSKVVVVVTLELLAEAAVVEDNVDPEEWVSFLLASVVSVVVSSGK